VVENVGMRKQGTARNPLFAKRWFSDDIIILCVRRYLRFRLSYRDLAAIAAEFGITVAPSTILRRVVRYTSEFVRRWAPFEMVVGRSWRADETYIKVKGAWMFLYRAVDERGRTIASYLSRTRAQTAARNFFRQALKRHGEPRTITLDGFEPSHAALRRMGMRNEFNFRRDNPVKIRSCKYLNNIVEQDHRRVKFRLSAMLGFKSFHNARIVIAGIELIHRLKKGQYGVPFRFGLSSRDIWSKVLAA
jgi:transposase-like protein